ncbi:helix-turn-helix domain-containing protein [Pseudoalteromonas sp. CnMc7-37]|uniref:helix-turn-helix domain-containing protein n=1 Tax=Pseudoalteromonas sp. CnMc7-37 TaxID=2954496 RepID=UPI002096E5FE|nr:helix-turn-helix domain-containing protein [Pseudoalteromonas sp. CnMc7-37]MCO7204826.1 helix-turn-helix domain-containing protein [Pseudoalteromonas sp. CnMc7-37]
MELERKSNAAILEMIGKRFLQARLNEGLDQREVAVKAGVNVSTIQNLESGKHSVGMIKVLAVMRALGKLHEIDNFMPEPPIKSASLLTTRNIKRKRVTKPKGEKESSTGFVWNKMN